MAAAAQNGRRRLLPLARTVRRKASLNWPAQGAAGAGPGTKPITGRLSEERRQAASGAAAEEALAYVEVAAPAEGGKRPEAGRALIGRRPRARGGAAEGRTAGNDSERLAASPRMAARPRPGRRLAVRRFPTGPRLPPLAKSERVEPPRPIPGGGGGAAGPSPSGGRRKPEGDSSAEAPPLAVRAVSKQRARQSRGPFHLPATAAWARREEPTRLAAPRGSPRRPAGWKPGEPGGGSVTRRGLQTPLP